MKHVIIGLRVALFCTLALGASSCGDDSNNAVCGNGILEPGEKCDTSIPQGQNGACPDVGACDDRNPCTADFVTDTACQATCTHTPITAVIANDGCCVSGDPMREPECMGCGDGVVDPAHGEICDTGIPAGQAGHCPAATDCPATQCKALAGSACMAHCEDITTPSGTTQDGCCPPGATSATDADCNAVCGNGMVENGEQCDTGIASGAGKCPTNPTVDCNDNQACTTDTIQGTNCQAHCVHTPITTASGSTSDGCCPSGANHNTDVDCSATCGNGVVEAGETCDTGITSGAGQCPTTADCDDSNSCTTDMLLSGGTCNATCAHTPITAVGPSDSCCPPAGNANTDPDCSPICGNGALEQGENCDTAIPAGAGHCPASRADCNDNNLCTVDDVSGSGCQAQCTHTLLGPSGQTRDMCCPPGANANTDIDCLAACGNGVVEPSAGELCDTGIVAGMPGSCPTVAATDCNDNDPCTADSIGGAGCTAHCVHTPIGPSGNTMDMCCPAGANHNTDVDCSVTCGNGAVEAGETCDTAITSGPGRCPTDPAADCNDNDGCTVDTIGSPGTCNAICIHTPITAPSGMTMDGCCPPGANISNDVDCPQRCGDGIVTNPPEVCDGAFSAGNAHFQIPGGGSSAGTTCATSTADCSAIRDATANAAAFPDGPSQAACYSPMYSGSMCTSTCTYAEAGPSSSTSDSCCPAHNGGTGQNDIDCAQCGNGILELGEQCDGAFDATNAHTAVTSGTTCPRSTTDCDAVAANSANSTAFPDGAACYISTFSGAVNQCNATCNYAERTPSGTTSDGCCPAQNGGNESNDVDCPATCGNGLVANGGRETCDTAIGATAAGHCPTVLECRSQTTNACSPMARTRLDPNNACTQTCQGQTVMLPGASEINCVTPNANPPTNCLMPPIVCSTNLATCSTNLGTCGTNCCCSAIPLPPCCTGFDGCCPPPSASVPTGGLDSFLFDPVCVDPNGPIPTNCGSPGQPRCCSPSSALGGDKDCYCGDGNAPAAAGVHGETCEDPGTNHNNFDGCTDSCTAAVSCTPANGCTPGTSMGTGTPHIGIPCIGTPNSGGPGGSILDTTYCQTGTTGMFCGTERIDPRFPGGYCSFGSLTSDCGAADPCPAGNTCVNASTTSFACIGGCGPLKEYGCRNQEGYHCVPLPVGPATPFCGPTSPGAVPPSCVAYATDNTCAYPPQALACQGGSPDPNCDPLCGSAGHPACCCVCSGCANICGDGLIETITGEQCDLGAAFIDPVHNYPTNYATASGGNCTTSCTARTHWIGDPCHVGSEATDCGTLAGQVGGSRAHCLVYDPSMAPSLTANDPKFRTRYDVYTAASDPVGGFANNGYCSTDCSLTAQDCPTLPLGGGVTFRGVCVPGEGQDPIAGRGVCVFGCLSNTQCRIKEGYRCWPIANLLGLPASFLSEGPRACVNPGSPTDFQGP